MRYSFTAVLLLVVACASSLPALAAPVPAAGTELNARGVVKNFLSNHLHMPGSGSSHHSLLSKLPFGHSSKNLDEDSESRSVKSGGGSEDEDDEDDDEDVSEGEDEDEEPSTKPGLGSKKAKISRRGVRARGLYELEAEMGTLD